MSSPTTATQAPTALQAERLGARDPRPSLPLPAEKARMLLIVNPKATTVSARLKNLVAYALRGRYEVDAVETAGPSHATELSREAVAGRYDLVVAFGGDGTVNEAANGLAGSRVPLSILPGGCTNVVCRMLGIPTDVVDAAEHLLRLADEPLPRPIDLGRVNDRYFVSSAGIGMDADTTRWVDRRPLLKARAGPYLFSYASFVNFQRYARQPCAIEVEACGRRIEGVTAVIQNSDPYTYFNSRPVRISASGRLDSGTLEMAVLTRVRQRDLPQLAWKLLSARPVTEHRQVEDFSNVDEAHVRAIARNGRGARPFPIQVDGDYIGHHSEAAFSLERKALLVVA